MFSVPGKIVVMVWVTHWHIVNDWTPEVKWSGNQMPFDYQMILSINQMVKKQDGSRKKVPCIQKPVKFVRFSDHGLKLGGSGNILLKLVR
jgi:hypothetical protein